LVRIIDVSLGTARTIIMVKGKGFIASLIGFIEVFIWFIIVREALNTNESGLIIAISYSLGFSVGTYLGSILSNKFIEETLGVEVITTKEKIINIIRKNGYAVSVLNVFGQNKQKKYMLIIEIKNKKLTHLKELIQHLDKNAFIMINETKLVHNGYFK
jgi:uncharacterized protein YebE (UPF0316 family)